MRDYLISLPGLWCWGQGYLPVFTVYFIYIYYILVICWFVLYNDLCFGFTALFTTNDGLLALNGFHTIYHVVVHTVWGGCCMLKCENLSIKTFNWKKKKNILLATWWMYDRRDPGPLFHRGEVRVWMEWLPSVSQTFNNLMVRMLDRQPIQALLHHSHERLETLVLEISGGPSRYKYP